MTETAKGNGNGESQREMDELRARERELHLRELVVAAGLENDKQELARLRLLAFLIADEHCERAKEEFSSAKESERRDASSSAKGTREQPPQKRGFLRI